ncbi:hypothetical protein [Massilia sp. METH4]|uniref:XAC2610-related protein n=1 Tax=Massilia sp. METH4 TaxID=3123041 RepID=UPI0030D2999F
MWRTIFIALLGLASAPAWSAGKQCDPDAKNTFTFTWIPKTASVPTAGSMRITDRADRTVQVLDNLEYYYGDSEDSGNLVDGRDYNNDGCGDLVLVSSVAAIGNTSNTAFLYDPVRRRFVEHEGLSVIMGLDIDPRDRRCVTGFGKGGAVDIHTARHCWSNGRLVLKEE